MIQLQAFFNTLPIMLYGMVGIFVVIIIIYLLILGLNKAFNN
ncbi:MAG TPA: oxaloacetate decarboxylase [Clostridiales bacterium]|nr:oxaloacetate decarboxylase [Clostridiales bacterium]